MFAKIYSAVYKIMHRATRGRLLFVLIGIAVLACALRPDSALAADDGTLSLEEVYTGVRNMAQLVLSFITVIIWPILLAIGALMDNSLIFGAGMEDKLIELWSNIRNFVNVFFVLMLIVIALYNVVGKAGDNYAIKTILPKFIIALVAINFSVMIARTVLDGVNVLTSAVAGLNVSLLQSADNKYVNPAQDACFVEKLCQAKPQKDSKQPAETNNPGLCAKVVNPSDNCKTAKVKDDALTNIAKKFFRSIDKNNLSFVLAMSVIGNIQQINKNLGEQKSLEGLTLDLLFSVLIIIIYGFSFTALAVVLIVRIVVLWVVIALSPIAGLFYILPDNIKGDISGEFDVIKLFTQHAIAPFTIMSVLTIGNIMWRTFYGIPGGGSEISALSLGDINSVPLTDISSIHHLIIAIGTVAVVWSGVFAAASKTMAGQFTDKIKNFGSSIVTKGVGLLEHVPLTPFLKQAGIDPDKVPLKSLSDVWKYIPTKMEALDAALNREQYNRLTGGQKEDTEPSFLAGLKSMKPDKVDWKDKDRIRKYIESGKTLTPEIKTELNKFNQRINRNLSDAEVIKALNQSLFINDKELKSPSSATPPVPPGNNIINTNFNNPQNFVNTIYNDPDLLNNKPNLTTASGLTGIDGSVQKQLQQLSTNNDSRLSTLITKIKEMKNKGIPLMVADLVFDSTNNNLNVADSIAKIDQKLIPPSPPPSNP